MLLYIRQKQRENSLSQDSLNPAQIHLHLIELVVVLILKKGLNVKYLF